MTQEQALRILGWFRVHEFELGYNQEDLDILKIMVLPKLKGTESYDYYMNYKLSKMEAAIKKELEITGRLNQQ